jgi:hypothetical protein
MTASLRGKRSGDVSFEPGKFKKYYRGTPGEASACRYEADLPFMGRLVGQLEE